MRERYNHFDAQGRIRGRKGVEARKRRLERDGYMCVACLDQGLYRVATQVDHITPLHLGGVDVDDNTQSLCDDCHTEKTKTENFERRANLTHPEWLTPSAVPLTIVCGAPCSGKTTYCRQHAAPTDVVVDLDLIVGGTVPQQLTRQQLDGALTRRNKLLGTLKHLRTGKAWFVVSAPTQDERDWWQSKLGGEVRVLDPGIEVCLARCIERKTEFQVPIIQQWYRPQKWWAKDLRREVKKPIGLDGWPVD